MIKEKFYTIGGKLLDFEHVNFHSSQSEVEKEFGWEACMYWSTFHHTELSFQKECSVKPGDIFVDLGSNIGMSSRYAEKIGAKEIYAFEADPVVYESLLMNKGETWKTYNKAITDHRGMFEIGLWPSLQEKALVEAITLNDIFSICEINKIDFLKVDIEGSERSCFNTISDDTLRKIDRIFIEWHNISFISENSNLKMMQAFVDRINQAGFNGWIHGAGYQSLLYFWRI